MFSLSRRNLLSSMLFLPAVLRGDTPGDTLFNGRTLAGWKAGENRHAFRVDGGNIASTGSRGFLFYEGGGASFKNFELAAEVMTEAGARSALYFHTQFAPHGAPAKGFKVVIDNSWPVPGDCARTGSLAGLRGIYKPLAKDKEWLQLRVAVRAKQVQIWVNDTQVVDYVEPDPPIPAEVAPDGVLGHGTFALGSQDARGKVLFRNFAVQPLADDAAMTTDERPVVDDIYRDLLHLHRRGFPVLDCHTHLKGGLTLPQALANSRRLGIMYGIAINGGLGFPTTNDAAIEEYLASMKGQPNFVALQGEGREWVTLFSREAIAKFDYIFTDAMTFTNDQGKRVRLWIPEETGEIPDAEKFMDMLVDRILGILNHEPIDIHANPTFLPDVIARDYDRLWTAERMQKVIDAARANDIAIEINNRYRLPSPAFIKRAKSAGVKFSVGTNNGDADLGRIEYAVAMIKECGLNPQDMFIPKPDGQRAAQKRKGA